MAVDLHSWRFLSIFQINEINVAEIGNMAQVEAHRLVHEHIEGHFVDSCAAALCMNKCVDTRPHMIYYPEISRASAERILWCAIAPGNHFVMGKVRENKGSRKEAVPLHIVGQGFIS